MNPVDSLMQDHARMRRAIVEMSQLLEAAGKSSREEQERIVKEQLPAAQHAFFAALRAHEDLEDSIFSETRALEKTALPWVEIEKQRESIEEIFKIASALIHLMEDRNLYAIGFAIRRVSENLRDHFDYEEKNLFPRIRETVSTSMAAELKDAEKYLSHKEGGMTSRTIRTVCTGLFFMGFSAGCAHLPIDQKGAWTGPLPERPITVREAARVPPPWYGKVVAPFLLEVFSGGRVGLEYNEGRKVRASEFIRGIPIVGWVTVPYWCYESLTNTHMQTVANEKGIDSRRQKKYEAIIKRLDQEGRTEEAQNLRAHSPFDPANHPPNPLAQMPPKNLHGFKNKMKIGWVELTIGHRIALERNESRGLRKIEYWNPLLVPRLWEAFEAAFGRRMEDIAEEKHLDERWLAKQEGSGGVPENSDKSGEAAAAIKSTGEK